MKPFQFIAISSLFISAILLACNAVVPQEYSGLEATESLSDTTITPSPVASKTSLPEQTSGNSTVAVPGELAEKARQDLAQRLEISPESITTLTIIGQEFSTDAFYCRTTKERITKEESPQVITGQIILLSASGRRYEYHASDQTVIFCRSLP